MIRIFRSLAVVTGISVLVFLIFFTTPGADPAARLAGRGASPAAIAAVRQEYGLDRSIPVQYLTVMRRLFWTRDLPSFVNRGQLVVPAVLAAAPVTLALAVGAAVLWLGTGLLIGLVAAAWEGGPWDRLVTASGLIGVSIPVFWLGEMVNLVTQSRFRGWFTWIPPLGTRPERASDLAGSLILPCATLAVLYAGIYGRVLRTGLIAAYRQDYVRTARAKGLSETRILLRHALRNALTPAVALFGLDFGALVGGGTILTELVFGLHGLGRLTYDALKSLDLAMVMASVLYASIMVVAGSAAVDWLQRRLEPARG